ncbi:MAG: AMP-dependent synthetase/ligase [Candidatus Nanopelagicales bacterium]
MQEIAEPPLVPFPTFGNLTDDVERRADHEPLGIMLRRATDDGWRAVTAADFRAEVIAVAKGLLACGVAPGDRIGIMSATRYEWTLVDYAIWYAGAVPVPVYETSSAEQLQWILSDSGAVGVFLEGAKHLAVFDEVRGELAGVAAPWVIDDGGIEELVTLGAQVGDDELLARRAQAGPADVATIIYTSGTTGRPKGCVLTHGNCMFEVSNVINATPELFLSGKSSTLLFLPLAHVFGRLIELGCINSGTVLGHSADIKNILVDLDTYRPTFLLAVPRVFEKVYNSAEQKAAASGRGQIFSAAAATAIEYSKAIDEGGPGLVLRAKHAAFDKLVFGRLRSALGGRVEWAVSGGAPLGERLGHFFRGIGVTILEGYGLTETSAASTLNLPDQLRIGTVGRPIAGASVRIAEDGEVMLAGGQIFQGYWRNEQATAEAIEPDGWFHSGDIGELDEFGFLRITGRKKELIVTAGGKNVAPAVLEDRVRSHFLVSQCMVVGDEKPYIAALVTLDVESLAAWTGLAGLPKGMSLAEAAGDPQVRTQISAAIDEANRAVSHAEAIKRFEILPVDWTEEGGQLTPSLKLKRSVVMAEFAAEVEGLYS